ncbi:MAG: Maf family protein [Nocardioidaceae bacterium]
MSRRLVLASRSPARLKTLRAAGLDPVVTVPDVDETHTEASSAGEIALELAHRKAVAVAGTVGDDSLVVGCDSVLELDGQTYGKPGSADQAAARWHRMRGSRGILHTGHCLVDCATGRVRQRIASTTVDFADLDDEEIEAYVATGEPLGVAGAFTIDGRGGAFVRRIDGDPHTVVGISLPLLREMLAELDVRWTDLWV